MNHSQLPGYLKSHETSTQPEELQAKYQAVCSLVPASYGHELIWFYPFRAKNIMSALPVLSQQKPHQAAATGLRAGARGICYTALPLPSLCFFGPPS